MIRLIDETHKILERSGVDYPIRHILVDNDIVLSAVGSIDINGNMQDGVDITFVMLPCFPWLGRIVSHFRRIDSIAASTRRSRVLASAKTCLLRVLKYRI